MKPPIVVVLGRKMHLVDGGGGQIVHVLRGDSLAIALPQPAKYGTACRT